MAQLTETQPDIPVEDLADFISRFERIQEEEWGEDHRMSEDTEANFG